MEIKRCPFCGSKEVEIDGSYCSIFVHCLNEECLTDGPTKPTENEAIKTWNITSNASMLMVIIGALMTSDGKTHEAMEEFLNKIL